MASHAVFADKGFDGLFESLVDRGSWSGGAVRQGGSGEGEGEEKGPKHHQKAPLASKLGEKPVDKHDTY